MLARNQLAVGWAVVIAAALAAAYAPALAAGFIWDDRAHLTAPALRSAAGLARIWFEPGSTQQYYPLLHSWFWLQHAAWGGSPLGYHATNLALHGAAALLVFALLRRLEVPGAWLAAALFALHPVHVESVAWISEQKNTLSAVFYLGAALAYLRFDRRRTPLAYTLASALFLAAVLSKSVTATLPAALLVVLWWRRGRLTWRGDVLPLLPWLVFGLAAGLHTAWRERHIIGADGPLFDLDFTARALLAGRVVWFYLGKLLWPVNLTFIYPRWDISPAEWRDWLPLAALAATLVLVWRIRRRSRAPLATALLFAGTLFPVLGFLNVYPFQYSFVADHFQYLASIPVFASLAAGGVRLLRRSSGPLARPTALGWPVAPAALAVIAFAGFTWSHAHAFRDDRTLFHRTLAQNPSCWMAANNLAKELMTSPAGRAEAVALLRRALALRPDYFDAHNNLGLALAQSGRAEEGLPHARIAVRLRPDSHQAHNNLGIALAGSGRAEEALAAFARAVALAPSLPNLHENWAKALLLLGREREAAERFAHAADLRGRASSTLASPP